MLHILSKQTNKQKQISQLIKLRLEPVTINQVSIGWQEKNVLVQKRVKFLCVVKIEARRKKNARLF